MPNIYFPEDSYTTPDGAATALPSAFPSLYFAWKLFSIVWRDGGLANAGTYSGLEWSRGSHDTLKALERAGVRIHAGGLNNIDAANGPCVFIGNHMSTLETFVLPVFIQPRKEVTFVVKESLIGYPRFGPVLKSREPIVLKRQNPREDLATVMAEGCERLGRGISVIVFPQSTRSAALDPAQFNSIGVKLAARAGVPVVPVALCTKAWKVGRIVKDFGGLDPAKPVHFAFGAPLHVQGKGREEHAAVCAFIQERLEAWSGERGGMPLWKR